MSTFVLVHGSWHDGSAWKAVPVPGTQQTILRSSASSSRPHVNLTRCLLAKQIVRRVITSIPTI
jgi:hypothetical protein